MFQGVHTALATPFFEDGTIDSESFRNLIDTSIKNGITGVVPTGTTGESPTLTSEEHNLVIELAVKHTRKRALVMAGTGSNSTSEAIDLTQHAEEVGADAILLVAPYYNKPSQEGLFQHFRAIANATDLPIMLYSIPGRCGIEIAVETVVRLASACSNICAIKEAGGVTQRVVDLRAALPKAFEILSGDDALTIDFMKAGGCGVVSVASNLIPKVMVDLVKAMLEGRLADAQALHDQYTPLFEGFLKLDTNPVPIKAALELAGQCSSFVRLPMVRMPAEKKEILRKIMQDLKII
jgi:4-hydroxy-tetrahydrodipicolinate synthase